MTPYAQTLVEYVPANAQAAFAYDCNRYGKDPSTALLLTLLLGWIGGEAYYMGEFKRGIWFAIAAITGIGMMITVPMWIVRCFTIQNECELYNDHLAYGLACRYAGFYPYMQAAPGQPQQAAPVPPPAAAPQQRRTIGGVPAPIR